MIPTWNKQHIEAYLSASFEHRYKRKDVNITGILLARPEIETAQKLVLPNLDHWNYRSDFYTEFFCVGFMPYPDAGQSDEDSIVTVGGHRWYFSARAFNEVLLDIEEQTTWRYRSGCYLIVTNTRYDEPTRRAWLDFRHAMVVDVDQVVATGAVKSADELAELLFEFAKHINEGPSQDPVWEFSDKVGFAVTKRSLTDYLIDFLPKPAKAIFQRAKPFAIQELQPAGTA
jgi:hypothetical protein